MTRLFQRPSFGGYRAAPIAQAWATVLWMIVIVSQSLMLAPALRDIGGQRLQFSKTHRSCTPSFVVSFKVVQLPHFPMIAPTKSAGRHTSLKWVRTDHDCDRNNRFFNFIVWGDTSTLNTDPYCGRLRIVT